ncbi:MAG: hypothetical protein C3F02_01055 [Parcubacteria group bacterium]|nr:MAG: hypothetical protein C3F02_01055 [Parcubacteria group bacterium]
MNQFHNNNFVVSDNKSGKHSPWYRAAQVYVFSFILILTFVFGLMSGVYFKGDTKNSGQIIGDIPSEINDIFAGNKEIDVNVFAQAWQAIHNDYLDKNKVNDKDLFYGVISGMVSALGDPHSVFLTPSLTDEFTQELDGTFYGIGAELGRKNGSLVIIAPLDGSPAEKAGLKAGDRILAIDQVDATDMSVNEAISKIRGDLGKTVVLTILPPDGKETKDVGIVRSKIDIPSVKYKLVDGLAVVEITSFNSDTSSRFTAVAQKVLKDNPKGIIVDLRNDPGGFLDSAVEITSSWLEPGQVVVRETYGDKRNDIEHKAIKRLSLAKFKTVVLINEGSASASEIMAGALQDYGLAQVVGVTSFGKGSVQQLIPLTDNSSIKLTVARWLTPQGRTIDGQGIKPNFEVKLTEDDYNNDLDPQFDMAKKMILGE